MRLFFYNKTRAKSGLFRTKEDIELNFYTKRSSILKRNRKFLNLVFNLHMIDFAVRMGSIILFSLIGFSQFSLQIEFWTAPLTLPAASPDVVEQIVEQRLIYPIVLYKDGVLMSEGENLPLDRVKRLRFLRNKLNQEPRIIALLIIDQDTPMEFVFNLTEDLSFVGLNRISFATGSGKPRNIR
tara:strand:- start:47493 stop:48041 length:549 start_codon:yes stop_codon:yes gene_type:complete